MAYYAVLAAKGFLDRDQLAQLRPAATRSLGYHPDRMLVPGVEIGSGSLGHGLGLAVGTALGLRLTGYRDSRVVVLTGDAELDEGSNVEAIQCAGRLGLDRLMAVVIDNDSAALRLARRHRPRFVAEGWTTADVDGRDHAALARAYAAGQPGRPHAGRGPGRTEGLLMTTQTWPPNQQRDRFYRVVPRAARRTTGTPRWCWPRSAPATSIRGRPRGRGTGSSTSASASSC